MRFVWLLPSILCAMAAAARAADEGPDVEQLEQAAFQRSVAAVADSVVQIRTVGGLEQVEGTLLQQGPTTGLVVSSDGYIVSSSLGFVQQPTSILVRLPDGRQVPAKLIAHDKSRLLVLLKVEPPQPLQIPEPAAVEQIRVGQWAVAVGRTFDAEHVGVSVGVVSAVRRMYGRAIQTDASVSAANYGGPLVDIHGRVMGILVPMSPMSESELAGVKFYDSGIGFAVPLEHVLATLDRWKQGDDLLRGKLGVGLKAGNVHDIAPTISTVWPGSPAAMALWNPQDVIVAVEGQEISTLAQLRFAIVPHYAGDSLRVTVLRGEERIESQLILAGKLAPYRHAFLGVLPMRPDPSAKSNGTVVRSLWPESPAVSAGLRRGDRITKIGDRETASSSDAADAMGSQHPKESVELTIVRGKKELTLNATLATLPDSILTIADLPSAHLKASPPDTKPLEETDLTPLKLIEFSQETNYFKPAAEKGQRYGLLLWLGDAKTDDVVGADLQLARAWQHVCDRDRIILLIAHPEAESGWKASDLQYLVRLARTARSLWSLDPRRLVVGGQSKAGQIAYALALKSSNRFSGVVSIDAPLPRTLKIPEIGPSSLLSILAVESRDSPFGVLLRSDLQSLRKKGYPASWLQRSAGDATQTELDSETIGGIARWLDALDRF